MALNVCDLNGELKMSSDGYLPPGVSHDDVEYAAGWRPKKVEVRKKVKCRYCLRVEPHTHCPECGSIEHCAAECDMEG